MSNYVVVDSGIYAYFNLKGDEQKPLGEKLWDGFVANYDQVIIPDHVVREIGESSHKATFEKWLETAPDSVIVVNTPTGEHIKASGMDVDDWRGRDFGERAIVEAAEGKALGAMTAISGKSILNENDGDKASSIKIESVPMPDLSNGKITIATNDMNAFGEKGTYSQYAGQTIVSADIANQALEKGEINIDEYLLYSGPQRNQQNFNSVKNSSVTSFYTPEQAINHSPEFQKEGIKADNDAQTVNVPQKDGTVVTMTTSEFLRDPQSYLQATFEPPTSPPPPDDRPPNDSAAQAESSRRAEEARLTELAQQADAARAAEVEAQGKVEAAAKEAADAKAVEEQKAAELAQAQKAAEEKVRLAEEAKEYGAEKISSARAGIGFCQLEHDNLPPEMRAENEELQAKHRETIKATEAEIAQTAREAEIAQQAMRNCANQNEKVYVSTNYFSHAA